MEIGIGIAIGVVLAVAGFLLGRSGAHAAGVGEGRAEAERRLAAAAEAIGRGRRPQADAGSPEHDLYAALEQGWAPRETERQAALKEAIGRVSAFLDASVRAPLTGAGREAPAGELRERIERALGALEDLNFFLEDPAGESQDCDIVPLVQHVAREFAADQDVGVRIQLAEASVRATVNAQVLMDSLYLVLHNAGRFGGGATVDVTVQAVDGRALVTVRDRGEGFTEEAFKRAFDPFYSTSKEGLGLGLPHARMLIEGMGGRVELSNVPDGGAEVEVSFARS
jgi:signal transduction histidine kinase|tara:strand:- start:4545 stop:5390 length:846 start_codon:yes stop_codon:yes gene_type:complete